ncbi:MAG: hypothetical protein GTN59_16025 [Candidatus Dadabacteria bacterium]|nr:hypothetical protein [Candidatus Dadabacteria bacterium]
MKGKILVYIGAAIVIICFFLPWLNFPGVENIISKSGFQIDKNVVSLGASTSSNRVYFVYIIPILALLSAGLVFFYSKFEKNIKSIGLAEIILGILPLIFGIYLWLEVNRIEKETAKIFEEIGSEFKTGISIGIGLWGTVLGFLLIIIGGVVMMVGKPKEASEPPIT